MIGLRKEGNLDAEELVDALERKEDETEDDYKGIFLYKKHYRQEDLINLYEHLRFTMPFMVYRAMNFWPVIDFMCLYGHCVNNLIIITLAIYYNVNFVMFVNICCMCIFYLLAAIRINNIANKIALESSL